MYIWPFRAILGRGLEPQRQNFFPSSRFAPPFVSTKKGILDSAFVINRAQEAIGASIHRIVSHSVYAKLTKAAEMIG